MPRTIDEVNAEIVVTVVARNAILISQEYTTAIGQRQVKPRLEAIYARLDSLYRERDMLQPGGTAGGLAVNHGIIAR